MINIENLHKSYKKNKVLTGLNVDLNQPGITALLGPNGSGKTTLVKCILGMVLPDSGSIAFDGQEVKRQFNYRTKIAYLPQIAKFPANLTGRELISFMKNIKSGASKVEELIALFGLEKELDKKMSVLSGGTRQKLNLVLAFMYDAPFIILDEPSTGLDPLALLKLKKYLEEEAKRGKQILIITHILSLVETLADNVVFILEGNIYYQGGLKELIDQQGGQNLEHSIANILRLDAANI